MTECTEWSTIHGVRTAINKALTIYLCVSVGSDRKHVRLTHSSAIDLLAGYPCNYDGPDIGAMRLTIGYTLGDTLYIDMM